MVLTVQNLSLAVQQQHRRAAHGHGAHDAAPPPLVTNLSLQIAAGETHCLVGQSGSGKTLTGLAILGLLPTGVTRTQGHIFLGQREITNLAEPHLRQLRGDQMTMIFQEPMSALNPVKTVGWQVAEVLRIHLSRPAQALPPRARYARVLDLFAQVQLPDPARIYAAYPHQLSGGQRQRVMIAMALALQPKLLIADEPTTALDANIQGDILRLLQNLQQQNGTAILFITHDFTVVEHIGDMVTVLEHGQVREQGPARSVLRRPKSPYTQALLQARPRLVKLKPKLPPAPPLLTVAGLSKTYRTAGFWQPRRVVQALQGVSCTLQVGRTLGVVGESGSGKSTLVRTLLQLERPDAGSVRLSGQELVGQTRRELRKSWREMQMVFQDPAASLNPRRTIGASIAEGLLAHKVGTAAERAATVADLLHAVGLEPAMAQRYPHQFSGGQRQRIGIARALALRPKVIIFDEAVSALDVLIQRQILDLLQTLKTQFDLSYLFISHDLRVISEVADDLLVLQAGQVVEVGNCAEILSAPQHPYTQQLLASLQPIKA